jgi:hypothetical protein
MLGGFKKKQLARVTIGTQATIAIDATSESPITEGDHR